MKKDIIVSSQFCDLGIGTTVEAGKRTSVRFVKTSMDKENGLYSCKGCVVEVTMNGRGQVSISGETIQDHPSCVRVRKQSTQHKAK